MHGLDNDHMYGLDYDHMNGLDYDHMNGLVITTFVAWVMIA